MRTKVTIFESDVKGILSIDIMQFSKTHTIKDIKYSTCYCPEIRGIMYSALVIYEECEG